MPILPNITTFLIHKDLPIIIGMGSHETITVEDEAILEKLNYNPWGLLRNPVTWIFENVPQEPLFDRGYTFLRQASGRQAGHQHMDEYNLINMNGRVYDPVIGYFSNPDSTIEIPINSQGFNMLIYDYYKQTDIKTPKGIDSNEQQISPNN